MRNFRTFVALALASSLMIGSSFAYADNSDNVIAIKQWNMPSALDVMPALPVFGELKAPETVAAYAKPESVAWVDTPRVFRDFRTIADSGGHGSI